MLWVPLEVRDDWHGVHCSLLNVCILVCVYSEFALISLADPRESESFRPADLHHGMEVRIGLSKGPAHPSFIWFTQLYSMIQWTILRCACTSFQWRHFNVSLETEFIYITWKSNSWLLVHVILLFSPVIIFDYHGCLKVKPAVPFLLNLYNSNSISWRVLPG